MKRVSLKVAMSLKEAGYPQLLTSSFGWYNLENGLTTNNNYALPLDKSKAICVAPTYIEAWLWLWREKKIYLEIEKLYAYTPESYMQRGCVCGTEQCGEFCTPEFADPEEAIERAIDHLVDNNLIK